MLSGWKSKMLPAKFEVHAIPLETRQVARLPPRFPEPPRQELVKRPQVLQLQYCPARTSHRYLPSSNEVAVALPKVRKLGECPFVALVAMHSGVACHAQRDQVFLSPSRCDSAA